jgi:hypothetical protein
MIKILALIRYSRRGASSRLRFNQYEPLLLADGINVKVKHLFSDCYVQALQQNSKNIFEVLSAYSSRVKVLLFNQKFDLIWIEKEALPWLPYWLEKILIRGNVPYVLDYDDAVFHYYDHSANSFVKGLLAKKHPQLMVGASLVIAGNKYIADFARKSGAKNVKIVPTAIDLDRYVETLPFNIDKKLPCIGWIGQNSTANYLLPYKPVFEQLISENLAYFSAIGIDSHTLGLPMSPITWTEQTEVESIFGFDVGIMPLEDGPFERGKCGYKLIQYMACGLPVVASPVGVNCEIVEHGVTGFLASTLDEWEQALRVLVSDSNLRKRMGQAGRQKVEKEYCIQKTGPILSRLLLEVAKV